LIVKSNVAEPHQQFGSGSDPFFVAYIVKNSTNFIFDAVSAQANDAAP
jgi:hypothetical protein